MSGICNGIEAFSLAALHIIKEKGDICPSHFLFPQPPDCYTAEEERSTIQRRRPAAKSRKINVVVTTTPLLG
jgi:hypothetical protein